VNKHWIGEDREKGVGEQRTSLAVRQWHSIAAGAVKVHQPANAVKVVTFGAQEGYCLKCLDIRWHDVGRDEAGKTVFTYCRFCGKERGL